MEIMHLIYSPELGLQSENYADLGTKYWVVSRAVQAFIIFAVILVPFKTRFNKWLGLGLALRLKPAGGQRFVLSCPVLMMLTKRQA